MTFPGFPEEITNPIRIPEQFFHHALQSLNDLNELKLILYIFWRLERMEGPLHYIRLSDLLKDEQLIHSLPEASGRARSVIMTALDRAQNDGILLQADIATNGKKDKLICLNAPRGRAAVSAIQRGEWRETEVNNQPGDIYTEKPNIFQLYEANIGPLTPLIADALRDAEKTFQADWIEDAFQIAVERNKRNWHYIEAILDRWQKGGRDDRKDQQARRDTEEAIRKYGDWEK
jgi:DnaD/phage-associated family protein